MSRLPPRCEGKKHPPRLRHPLLWEALSNRKKPPSIEWRKRVSREQKILFAIWQKVTVHSASQKGSVLQGKENFNLLAGQRRKLSETRLLWRPGGFSWLFPLSRQRGRGGTERTGRSDAPPKGGRRHPPEERAQELLEGRLSTSAPVLRKKGGSDGSERRPPFMSVGAGRGEVSEKVDPQSDEGFGWFLGKLRRQAGVSNRKTRSLIRFAFPKEGENDRGTSRTAQKAAAPVSRAADIPRAGTTRETASTKAAREGVLKGEPSPAGQRVKTLRRSRLDSSHRDRVGTGAREGLYSPEKGVFLNRLRIATITVFSDRC